jgi:hypothetical protein
MRRCLLALALSVLALGAQPAAAQTPKPPAPLEMSGVADVLEAPPLDPTGASESDQSSDVQPVDEDAVPGPEQQAGNEAPPAEPEQQSEPDPAAAQPNDSSSDETVVAPAADPPEPQAEVTEASQPQPAAEPEVAPANGADSGAVSNSPEVQSDSGPSSQSPTPASQSAADGQTVNRPSASSAPTAKQARTLQVWEDAGGEPSAALAAPPTGVGNRAGGGGAVVAPEREPDLVPAHAGGLPTLLPVELISQIALDELLGEPVSASEASPPSPAGVAAVSVVKRRGPGAAAEAVRPKPTAPRPANARPGVDQTQPEARTRRPKNKLLKVAPTARRGPDFIVAAQRAAPGTGMNEERPPWLLTLLALLATAVSLAAITIIVVRPHVFRGKTARRVPRPREPEITRNEQAGIRYRE